MNSYERAITTLTGGIPDCVPTFELMIDPVVIRSILGNDDYMEFCEKMDIDFVVTPTPSKLYREECIDKADGIYRNEWGIVRQYGSEVVSIIREGPIHTQEDLDHYQAPDPLDEYRFESTPGPGQTVQRETADRDDPARYLQLSLLSAGHGESVHRFL